MNPWQLREAVRTLRNGGVIAYPTEAVYGLGCAPQDAVAVQRVLALKARPMAKGLILIASDFAQLEPFLLPLEARLWRRIQDAWPGPVTWLLPARPEVPDYLRGAHDTLAVRVTAHPVAAALCRASRHALVSTSANRSGQPPARSALGVRRRFGHDVDRVVPGPLGGRPRPTEIRDGRTGHTLRSG